MAHVANNSGNNEWYTPPVYIEAARAVLGAIDLDPASCAYAQLHVRATHYYTAETDGLRYDWSGNVWLNPPYHRTLIGKFASKYAYHVRCGDISAGIVLVNNATDSEWFQRLVSVSQVICFTYGRINFWNGEGFPTGKPLQGQAFLYCGNNTDKFKSIFAKFGWMAVTKGTNDHE